MAELTLHPTAATTLAVKAAAYCLLCGVFTNLGGVNGIIVVITTAGNRRCILVAQLTLLTTTAVALGLHATLDVLFPETFQTCFTIDPIAGILGLGLAHVNLSSNDC